MKDLIKEAKRMQQLAGIIKETQDSDKPYVMATDEDNDLNFTDELIAAFKKVGASEDNFVIYSEFEPNQGHSLATPELLRDLGAHYEIKPRK